MCQAEGHTECRAAAELEAIEKAVRSATRAAAARAALRERKRMNRLAEGPIGGAVQRWRAMTVRALQAGLRRGLPEGDPEQRAAQLIDWVELDNRSRAIFEPAIFRVVQIPSTAMAKAGGFSNMAGPETVHAWNYTLSNTGRLIREVNDETRKAVADYIRRGIAEGKSVQKIARELRGTVGLTSKMAGAVAKREATLLAQGATEAAARKAADKYAARLLKYREMMIARTEKAFALAEGIRLEHEKRGVKTLEWVTDGACPYPCVCPERDGKRYSTKEAAGMLPAHPQCECTWLVADDWDGKIQEPTAPKIQTPKIPEPEIPSQTDLDWLDPNELTPEENVAIQRWCGTWYTDIRRVLNGKYPIPDPKYKMEYAVYKDYREAADRLLEMLEKFGKKAGARAQELHRGINVDKSVFDSLKKWRPGELRQIDTVPQSWSLRENVAENFALGDNRVMFHIEPGRKMTAELDLSKEINRKEAEVLMQNTDFQVVSVQEKTGLRFCRLVHVYLREAIAKAAMTNRELAAALSAATDWKAARIAARNKKRRTTKRAYAR